MRVLLLICLLTVAVAQKVRYDNYKVYRVVPTTQAHVNFLVDMQANSTLDFWREAHRVNQAADVMVSPEKQADFEKQITDAGMEVVVLNHNVQENIDKENGPASVNEEVATK